MTEPKKQKRKRRRLDGKEWREAEILWASGEWTLKQISDKYGPGIQAIYQHMRKRGVEKNSMRDEFQEVADEEIRNTVKQETDQLMKEALDSKKITVRASVALQKMIMQSIKKARDEEKGVATVHGEIKAIQDAIKAIGEGWNNVSKSLGLDKDDGNLDELPELVVSTLTKQDIAEIRIAHDEQEAMMNGTEDDETVIDLDDIAEITEE